MFQSTHPHGVRPAILIIADTRICVSIHAPTRGATKGNCYLLDNGKVSIHAPTRGATQSLFHAHGARMFQSTHPHGVRLSYIHNNFTHLRFQSTHPHGVRQTFAKTCIEINIVSIHAPTRGATFHRIMVSTFIRSFNPRTHTGCDVADKNLAEGIKVSIHAPTRGATSL